jgi:hypothetical protein
MTIDMRSARLLNIGYSWALGLWSRAVDYTNGTAYHAALQYTMPRDQKPSDIRDATAVRQTMRIAPQWRSNAAA